MPTLVICRRCDLPLRTPPAAAPATLETRCGKKAKTRLCYEGCALRSCVARQAPFPSSGRLPPTPAGPSRPAVLFPGRLSSDHAGPTRKRPAFTSEVGAFADDGEPSAVSNLPTRYGGRMAPIPAMCGAPRQSGRRRFSVESAAKALLLPSRRTFAICRSPFRAGPRNAGDVAERLKATVC